MTLHDCPSGYGPCVHSAHDSCTIEKCIHDIEIDFVDTEWKPVLDKLA